MVPFFPLGQSGVKPTPNTRLFPRFHSSGAERGGLGSYRKVQKGLTLTIKTLSVDENKNNHVLLGSVLKKNGPRSLYDPLPTNDRFKPNLLSFLYFWSPCSAAREHFSNLDYLVKLAASFTFLAVVWTVSEGWQLWFKTNAVQTPLAQSTQKHFF